VLDGFLLLQSVAGGTGAGLGTYVAEALRDEYGAAAMLNVCVWPHDSGEVSVQAYNAALTLSHLFDASDGLLLLPNDALHATCVRLHNLQRPGFADMNAVAARALAQLLLPASQRPAAVAPASPPGPAGRDRDRGGGDRGGGASSSAPFGSAGPAVPFRPLADTLSHLCGHPGCKLLALRAVPALPAAHVDFTSFNWQSQLRRLRAMVLAGALTEEGFTHAGGDSPGRRAPGRGAGNRCLASVLVLRGNGAREAAVEETLGDARLYADWALERLKVRRQRAAEEGGVGRRSGGLC